MQKIEIASNLYKYTFAPDKANTLFNKNIYCLVNMNNALLIDASFTEEMSEVRDDLKKNDIIITDVIVSHYHLDHYFGLQILQNVHKYGSSASKEIFNKDKPEFTPFLPTQQIDEPYSFQFGDFTINIEKAPGHSKCHLHTTINDSFIHIGDTIMLTPDGKSILPLVLYDIEAYIGTLKELRKKQDYIFLPGHGPVIEETAKKVTEIDTRITYLENLLKLGKAASLEACIGNTAFLKTESHSRNLSLIK